MPILGQRRLDEIGFEDGQQLKATLRGKSAKTVNNILSVLKKLLWFAVEVGAIEEAPTIRLLKTLPPGAPKFHDFDEYERLLNVAPKVDAQANLIVLLAGDAGLRCGEIMALEITDLDFTREMIHVQRSEWKGQVGPPKGGRDRRVPMTQRLATALHAHRHMRGPRVLCQEDGAPLTQKVVENLVRKVARRAGLANDGVHLLRHTFCSHLAMRGLPPITIMEWAGHQDLKTTMRYMHLSPKLGPSAIRCLEDEPPAWWTRGVETEATDARLETEAADELEK